MASLGVTAGMARPLAPSQRHLRSPGPARLRGGQAGRPLTRPAVVDVRLAVAPRVARLAVAAVAAVGVLAGGAVAARALHALVDVHLAGLPWGEGASPQPPSWPLLPTHVRGLKPRWALGTPRRKGRARWVLANRVPLQVAQNPGSSPERRAPSLPPGSAQTLGLPSWVLWKRAGAGGAAASPCQPAGHTQEKLS